MRLVNSSFERTSMVFLSDGSRFKGRWKVMKLAVHSLQHAEHEDLGTMLPWFLSSGSQMSVTGLFESNLRFPSPDAIDFLVVLGGPMGVYEEKSFPWLTDEIAFIQAVIKKNKPVLGVCLGAQLIAAALGGKVYPHDQQEIGWFPVVFQPKAPPWFSLGRERLEVLHWHGDTFDLPAGATLLASSAATKNQAFLWGDRVLGLQFHLEVADTGAFINHADTPLVRHQFVQTADEIRQGSGDYHSAHQHLVSILEYLQRMANP